MKLKTKFRVLKSKMPMLTLAGAKSLSYGTILYHRRYRNADGTPSRAKVTGAPQVWKTRPNEVRVPWKHGLYVHGAVTEVNLKEWSLRDGTMITVK